MADINVTEEIIDINVTEEVITIEAPTGAYPFPNAVFSVFGRVGSIVAAEGDYSLTQLSDVTLTSPANGQVLKYNGTSWVNSTDADTGITTLNTLTALSQTFATGTSGTDFNISSASSTHTFNFPTASATNRGLLSSSNWSNFNTAYNDSIISAAVTGTTTKTLTLNQQDGGTVTASWTDINTDAVTSVFGRTGAVVAASGDYTTTQVTEGTNLYFTDARARAAISLTTTGTSGAATYSGGTLNIPQYQGVLTNPVTGTGTTNTLPKFTAASTIGNSNITDTGSLITLGSNSYVNGRLWIGTTNQNNISLANYTNMTGSTSVYGQLNAGIIQSDATVNAFYYDSFASTVAASFTLANLIHYRALQGSFGAGSSVTLQTGFEVNANLIGATTNYGFRGRIASGANRWNLFMDGTAANYMAGSLGIGNTSLTGINFRVFKNVTGGTTSYNALIQGAVQSDVTTAAFGVTSELSTQAATFTLPTFRYFFASQSTIGAGSTVTNQAGFWANSNLIGATNNYGFYGEIPAQANTWNLYMAGTANNYMAGSLGIGTTSLTQANLFINKNLTGSTTMYGILNMGQVQSGVTTNANYYATFATVQNTAFTLGEFVHYRADSAGSYGSATITNQYGFFVQNTLTGATNNFGFYGNIPSGTNRWNLYMAGTAANYMAGSLNIGTTSVLADYPLNAQGTVNGNLLFRFANLSNGTGARMGLILGTDFGAVGSIDAYSTTYTGGTADDTASGVRILASGVGGLSLRANNASATIRIYTGSTERVRVKSQGQMRFVPLASDPSGAEAGDVYYNSTTNKLKVYNGTAWETITSA